MINRMMRVSGAMLVCAFAYVPAVYAAEFSETRMRDKGMTAPLGAPRLTIDVDEADRAEEERKEMLARMAAEEERKAMEAHTAELERQAHAAALEPKESGLSLLSEVTLMINKSKQESKKPVVKPAPQAPQPPRAPIGPQRFHIVPAPLPSQWHSYNPFEVLALYMKMPSAVDKS